MVRAVRLTLRFVTRASHRVVLDFAGAPDQIEAVTRGGRSVDVVVANGHITVPSSAVAAGENVLDIRFRPSDAPLNRNADFLYTIFVPARAHLAFPCFDQPDLKARFTLSLSLPAGWEAVSNGAEKGRSSDARGQRLQFAETAPISTYLFAFAAGQFQVDTAERAGRTYRLLHRETDAAKVARNRDVVFDLHAGALAWLESYTGIPYPFGKFDFVAVPSFQFGGMEHPGAIFYNAASVLLDESATENQLLGRASVIAHETAHMWFGDLVTMKWFDDVWMKEVFANFMAAKIVNPAFPQIDHELRFLTAHYPQAYTVDRTEGTHPIRQELANLSDAGTLYGPIIYQKAPIVMRQLERLIGPDTLQAGLRSYLQQFSFRSAAWSDLVQILDARTPHDLAAWSRAWVDNAGRPRVVTDLRTDEAGRVTALSFRQEDPQAGRTLRWPQQMDVLLGTSPTARSVSLVMETDRVEVADTQTLGTLRFVLANGGGLAYGDFSLDPRSRAFLLEHVEELPAPVSRGASWVTLWEELLDKRLEPMTFLNASLRALAREDVEQNVQLIANYLNELFWRFLRPEDQRAVASRLESTLRAGLARARTSSLKATYFSAFYGTVTTPEGVAWLERVWRRQQTIPGLVLAEPDEATMALELAVRSVPAAESIVEEQLTRFQNPDRRARFEFVTPAVSERRSTRDARFASLDDPANRRREPWVVEALRYLNHPLRAIDALRYLPRTLTLLEEIQQTGDIFFPSNWMNASLSGHNSRDARDDVRRFLAANPEYPVRLRRIVLQAADPLFRASDILPRDPR